MSRRRKKRLAAHHHHQHQRVSSEQWQRFLRFEENWPYIEETLADLQENWEAHVHYLADELRYYGDAAEFDVGDTIRCLTDLLLDCRSNKKKFPPSRFDRKAMVTEIIIEDVSDGEL